MSIWFFTNCNDAVVKFNYASGHKFRRAQCRLDSLSFVRNIKGQT